MLLSCRTNKPTYISKQQLQQPLIAGKNGPFLFRMPGMFLSFIVIAKRNAAPSHGTPRRDEEID